MSHFGRTRLGRSATVTALLTVTVVASWLAPQIAYATKNVNCGGGGCARCQEDGCRLDPGETLSLGLPYKNALTCIDFDGNGVGHCCTTPRQVFYVFDRSGYNIGFCFKTYCYAATPQSPVCPNPWFPRESGGPPSGERSVINDAPCEAY